MCFYHGGVKKDEHTGEAKICIVMTPVISQIIKVIQVTMGDKVCVCAKLTEHLNNWLKVNMLYLPFKYHNIQCYLFKKKIN